MKNCVHRALLLVALFTGTVANRSKAHAELLIRYSVDDGISFINELTLNVGQSADVDIYVDDTDPFSVLEEGLQSMGLRGTFNTGFGQITSVDWDDNFSSFPKGEFDNATGTLELEGFNFGGGVSDSTIRLGSFTFKTTTAGTTTFELGDLTVDETNFLTSENTELDLFLFGADRSETYGLTISAVPEPSMFAGLAITSGGILLRRRRRGRSGS